MAGDLVRKWFRELPASLLYKEKRLVTSNLSVEQTIERIKNITTSDWTDFLRPISDKPLSGSVESGIVVLHFRPQFGADDQVLQAVGRIHATDGGSEMVLTMSYGDSTLIWLISIPMMFLFMVVTFFTGKTVPIAAGCFFFCFTVVGYFWWFRKLQKDMDRMCAILARLLQSDPDLANAIS